jgi:hypothetical protein
MTLVLAAILDIARFAERIDLRNVRDNHVRILKRHDLYGGPDGRHNVISRRPCEPFANPDRVESRDRTKTRRLIKTENQSPARPVANAISVSVTVLGNFPAAAFTSIEDVSLLTARTSPTKDSRSPTSTGSLLA